MGRLDYYLCSPSHGSNDNLKICKGQRKQSNHPGGTTAYRDLHGPQRVSHKFSTLIGCGQIPQSSLPISGN